MFPIFGRILPDQMTRRWNHLPRTADPEWRTAFPNMNAAPATCELYDKPYAAIKAHATKYDEVWWGFVSDVNALHGSENAYDSLRYRPETGWVNKGAKDTPEPLVSAWEYVNLITDMDDSYKVAQLYTSHAPPSIARVNYHTAPDLIQRITTINEKGEMGLVSGGKTILTTLASKYPLYIKKERVRPFPVPPVLVQTTRKTPLYAGVEGVKVWDMPTGTWKKVRQYALRGGLDGVSVWGVDVVGLAWKLKEVNETYSTTWRDL